MDIEKISANEYKFIFHNSTSTIGKLLQNELLKDSNIIFAGYSCPHPLESRMILRIITTGKNPKEVITSSINNIVSNLDKLDSAIKSLDNSD